MEKVLRPIIDKDLYFKVIWFDLQEVLFDTLFRDLFALLNEDVSPQKRNAVISGVLSALSLGSVQYSDGRFVGSFNAKLSKELKNLGATYDRKEKAYKIREEKLPLEYRVAISSAKSKFQIQGEKLVEVANGLNKIPKLSMEKALPISKKVMEDLEHQFKVTTPKDLSVPAGLTAYVKGRLEEEYVHSLNHYLEEFSKKEIVKIRETVSEYVAKGYRADKMVKVLKARYSQTQKKAKFLARQETSLMVSKYREARYGEAGITQYKWSTSSDERVRPDHRILNNRIFRFDDPPITDRATGARGNPGEPFNCRCVALPIYRSAE